MKAAFAFSICLAAASGFAANWPQWRGPDLNGSTSETNLPATWSKTDNVLWSAPLPGPSHATPIVWDDSVFVNTPDADANLLLMCLDRHSGAVRWQKQVAVGNRVKGRNNMASPSPVTDGNTVWTMFGTGDLAAFDFSGKQLWARSLTKEYGRFIINWLYGCSPLLYKGRLYVEVLRRVPGDSFLLCLDPQTGSNIWRQVRPTDAIQESQEAYSTPMPAECAGRTEIIVVGGDYVTGHDAATGQELWRGGGLRNFDHRPDSRLVPSPVVADGLVFVCGAKRNPFLAFYDCGKGDITTSGLAWSSAEDTTDCATPLFYQDKLFMLDGDKQTLVCFEPKTGKVNWRRQLGVREIFRASPTGADGRIYCFSEYATAVVLSAADGQILSTIKMSEGDQTDEGLSHSTIAAAQGCLFIRAPAHLYCIAKK
ncbi:MAG TPA: PQQ-binding-like beta-propeller repeat protein [Candidatus Baltobacteraceae bacterium]|jgi:outer membrane protein assembly factor BamB|nr:PQQ-binding-like beta-propeller repeat protein [Candidatus Baltobacteraceae bacterium]